MKNSYRMVRLSLFICLFVTGTALKAEQPPVRPTYTNASWKNAACEGLAVTKDHIIGLGINYALTKYIFSRIAPWFFRNPTYKQLAISIPLFYGLTALSLRYKKDLMKRFEEESSCKLAIDLASGLLPSFSLKMQLASIVGATCYLWNEKEFETK